MNWKTILLITFLFYPFFFTNSQNIIINNNTRFKNLSVENGLSHIALTQIYQDSEGFIWICTYDGLNRYNGKTFKIITETLKKLGYHIKFEVLNSMTYGNIPQNRERIFIVGFLDKKKADAFEFPKPIILTKNFKEFMVYNVSNKYYYNDKPLFKRIKNDINSEDVVYQWRRKYVRANKKGVVPTLTANMGLGGHNVPIILDSKGIRKLTPKECFLLQGYPLNFKLPINLSDSKLYHQAGNSVTVPLIVRIAIEMKKVLV